MSERLGGPMGAFASRSYTLLPPIQALIVLAAFTYSLGYFLDYSCLVDGWQDPMRYMHLCYTDIPALYAERGFAEGIVPYLQTGSNGAYLEYPVLTGLFMFVTSWLTHLVLGLYPDGFRAFFDVNVVLLFIPFAITVVATALTFHAKPLNQSPWRASMIVFAPLVILGATINWDLIPVALVALALLAWSRDRYTTTGVFLGLAIAAKFYPLVLLIGFVILAARLRTWRPTVTMLVATGVTFLAVNIPFAVANFEGWVHFYTFNADRSIDFGSIWYAINQYGLPTIPESVLNLAATGLFAALLIAIALFVYRTATPPTIYQVLFLVLAAFVITNKVYSPQYVLWLIPLAVLARPNWRDFLIWQFGELIYFAGIWWFLAGYGIEDSRTLTPQWYATATFIHIGATLYFAIMVIRDIQTNSTASNREVVNRTSVGT
ncbi:MAG: glycosyltransferase 87 family protein [Candidatus Nanopelagicales bacterium]|nr:glycosyltransferase 87 family protein [Candidatus Nanopelagicales bacterium]